jgi:hypothetical protein
MNDMTDDELYILRLKYDEKLIRYMKLYNECTERSIEYIKLINNEIERRINEKCPKKPVLRLPSKAL